MKRLLMAAVLVCSLSLQAWAGCKEIFVRFYYPNGGDNTWSLRGSGDGFEDITGRVQLYKKNGVWTLTAPGGATWTRAGDACDLGGGFTLTNAGTEPTPNKIVVVQSL